MYMIGTSQFFPTGVSVHPLNYKTGIFEVTTGTSISEVYDYMNNNPEIYWLFSNSIPHNWGDQITGPVQGYVQTDIRWEPTNLPEYPMVLHWIFCECDVNGNNPIPRFDITTPSANLRHFEAI